MTIVLDGSAGAGARIERVLKTHPGIGVTRHADAGHETARELIARAGLVAPMLDPGRT
jgi:urocanate hydratase